MRPKLGLTKRKKLRLFRLRLPSQLNNLHLVHLLDILQVKSQLLGLLCLLTIHLVIAKRILDIFHAYDNLW